MLKFLYIFGFNLLFNSIFIQYLFNRNSLIAYDALLNIQKDLERISFPAYFELNYFFVAVTLGILLSTLVYFFVNKSGSFDNPVAILNDLMSLLLIFTGSVFSIFYLLGLYSMSRGTVLLAILLYPILAYLFLIFLNLNVFVKSSNKILLRLIPVFITFLIFSGLILYQNRNSESAISVDSINTTTTTIFENIDIGTSSQNTCFPWLGSDNFNDCLVGAEILSSTIYSTSLNNVIVFKDDFYVLDVSGKVFKNSNEDLFLDISNKVLDRTEFGTEAGLFSIAFHPTDNYFLISFSNTENYLTVEKYYLDNNFLPQIENIETVISIPNAHCCHYSGNLIWSNFFNDFLLSVGDMKENGLLSSEPFDTTSPRGKILFLNNKISQPDLLSLDKNQSPRNDIIAFGLRNPWKTSEYKNYLFVPDIGLSTEEELNIVDLNQFLETKKPYLFGWPHYEGTISTGVKYNEIFLQISGQSLNINNYISENTIMPSLYYQHQAPQNFRPAIIGGDVVEDSNSKYYEHYIFADYLSNEVFAYDFKNDNLSIVPLDYLGGFITSVTIHPKKFDTIMLTLGTGNLVEILLP